MKTGYHWKQVEAGLHAEPIDRPGIAWSEDYRDVRAAMKHRPFGAYWLLVRNRDGAIAAPEHLADFEFDWEQGQASTRQIRWCRP